MQSPELPISDELSELVNTFTACAKRMENTQKEFLRIICGKNEDEAESSSFSDGLLRVAVAVTSNSIKVPWRPMGTKESVMELHPNMFRWDDMGERLTVDQVRLLTASEKLAFAATGCYEGTQYSVPANMVQLFGKAHIVELDPAVGWMETLSAITVELRKQLGEDSFCANAAKALVEPL